MPDIKKIKGEVIRITDATEPSEYLLELEVDPTRAKQIGATTYIELDLTTPSAVTIALPQISSLGGFLQYQIYIVDKAGTISKDNQLNVVIGEVESGELDTIMGQQTMVMQDAKQAILLTPACSDTWFATFGLNACSATPEGAEYRVAGILPVKVEEEKK